MPRRQDFRCIHRLRVRWAEVDLQAIVFNGHYLTYFDTAITDYWRQLGLPYAETFHALEGDLYVKKATVEYHASATMDDWLDVGIRCQAIGRSSMTFVGAIYRDNTLLISSEIVYVFADPIAKKSLPVPSALRGCIERFERGDAMLQVRTGNWLTMEAWARPVREQVFVQEMSVPSELEWDRDDVSATHCVVLNHLGHAVATGRWLEHAPGVARLGRIAVKKPLRGTHVGHQVLEALIQDAKAHGANTIKLHAQLSASPFYQRHGFVQRGSVFEEAGIPHIQMVLASPEPTA